MTVNPSERAIAARDKWLATLPRGVEKSSRTPKPRTVHGVRQGAYCFYCELPIWKYTLGTVWRTLDMDSRCAQSPELRHLERRGR